MAVESFAITDLVTEEEYTYLMLKHGSLYNMTVALCNTTTPEELERRSKLPRNLQKQFIFDFLMNELNGR